jgi:polysaccharide export outer membrane protein
MLGRNKPANNFAPSCTTLISGNTPLNSKKIAIFSRLLDRGSFFMKFPTRQFSWLSRGKWERKMNRFMLVIAVVGVSLVSVSAQVKSAGTSGPGKELLVTNSLPAASRARIVGRSDQLTDRAASAPVDPAASNPSRKSEATAFNHARNNVSNDPVTAPGSPKANAVAGLSASVPSASLSQLYRVGVGDVLDVQLADMPTSKSTLFTVLEGGALDYPLAGGSVTVAGLTADEVATQLRARIKVLENPRVVVKVRDYSSHNVIVTGYVSDPGAKFLRREAVPLYVVLVEAQPRSGAIGATIMRNGQPAINVDLTDQKSTSMLVMPGDLIKVLGPATEATGFFYAGGALNSPGQKAFHSGLTLTQAILASGGITHAAGSKARISRQGADGRLTTTEYNLRQIEDGKVADPVLQRGDRVTVSEGR